jgi:Tfp pilus assembly protein PilZ
MGEGRSRRKSLRVPVKLDVRFDRADGTTLKGRVINLSTEGIFIKTPEPMELAENVTMEFLLPGTLNSIQVTGRTVWTSSYEESEEPGDIAHAAGITFINLEEPYRSILREHILKMLDDGDLIRSEGIVQVLDDIRNLPCSERLEAYRRLIKRSSDSVLE